MDEYKFEFCIMGVGKAVLDSLWQKFILDVEANGGELGGGYHVVGSEPVAYWQAVIDEAQKRLAELEVNDEKAPKCEGMQNGAGI